MKPIFKQQTLHKLGQVVVNAIFSSHFNLFLYGLSLALLLAGLKWIEYRYFIGQLSTDIYVMIIAVLFTTAGIWMGMKWSNSFAERPEPTKKQPVDPSENLKKFGLNTREYEVLQLIAEGYTNQEIADQLFIALPTVKTHASNLYAKLDVKRRTQAVNKAKTLQLID